MWRVTRHFFDDFIDGMCCFVNVYHLYLPPQMSSIKRVRQRLESMLFYAKFSELVDDLKPVSLTWCDIRLMGGGIPHAEALVRGLPW